MSLTLSQIETAFGQAVAAIPEIDRIAWPSRVIDPARPFVMFQHNPSGWSDRTVTGGDTIPAGSVILTVVSEAGQFGTASNALADTIMALFPKGRRIEAGSGCIVITEPARPIAATMDGADWRQVIEIAYTTQSA